MNKKERLISKRQKIFNKQLQKPVKTFFDNKKYNNTVLNIHKFCRHYNIAAIIKKHQLVFSTDKNSIFKKTNNKNLFENLSNESIEVTLIVKKNRI